MRSILVTAILSLALMVETPAKAQDGQQTVGAFMGLVGGLMQQAIEQQQQKDQQQRQLEEIRNSPEYRDQELQPGGLTRGQVVIVQQLLIDRGFDLGTADGVIGPKTRAVVGRLQAKAGVPVTGYPTNELLQALLEPVEK